MTEQLELFTPPAEPPPSRRVDVGQLVRSANQNTQGTCCGHWRLQHRQADGGLYGNCDFCQCPQFSNEPVDPPCCRTGLTGHCVHGRHDQCAYSPGGACYGGIIQFECYVVLPPAGGWPGTDPFPNPGIGNGILVDAAAAVYGRADMVQVVEPSHRIVCGCDCHLEAVANA